MGDRIIGELLVPFDSADQVAKWLTAHNISYTREQRFEGLKGEYDYLRFDLWLPDYNTCIEVDGQQHYRACKNDSMEAFLKKRNYARKKEFFCLQHGIRLVRIVYDEIPYLDQSLDAQKEEIDTRICMPFFSYHILTKKVT